MFGNYETSFAHILYTDAPVLFFFQNIFHLPHVLTSGMLNGMKQFCFFFGEVVSPPTYELRTPTIVLILYDRTRYLWQRTVSMACMLK